MPITRVGNSSANLDNGTVTTAVLNVPAGTVDDDLLLLMIASDGTNTPLPAGFTAIYTNQLAGTSHVTTVGYRVASSEPASYSVSAANNNERAWCCLASYRGVDTTSPIENNTINSGNGTSITFSALTPSEDNCCVVAMASLESGNSGNPVVSAAWISGLTEQNDNVNGPPGNGASSSAGAFADQIQTTAAQVSGTQAVDGGTTNWNGVLVSLREASAGSTTYTLTADAFTTNSTFADATFNKTGPQVYTLSADSFTTNTTFADAQFDIPTSTPGTDPYYDDYVIIGAAGDNFDCDSTTGWVGGGVAVTPLATNTTSVEGTNSILIQGNAAGLGTWEQDLSSGNRFKITDEDLHFWFFYSKGKSPPYLTSASTAIVVRLYFGGTTDWADYRVTDTGDTELTNGWQVFQLSGKEQRGGSTSGTWSNTDSNWARDIHRVQLRLDFANPNNGGSDGDLLMDCWFKGTTITVASGTSAAPITFDAVETYSDTRAAFPLGLVETTPVFVNLRCGIRMGNGSNGTNNEGNITETSRFLLFNQASEDVKHPLTVERYSTFIMGEKEVGTDGTYAVRGCQLVLPANRYSDIDIKNGGVFRAYNSKLFRWRDIFFGAASDNSTTVELINVDIDSNETVYFRATNLTIDTVELHNNPALIRPQAAEMTVSPDSCTGFLLYDNDEAMHFRATLSINEFIAQDNSTYDLAVLEGATVTINNGVFDSTSKIARLAS